MNLSKFVPKNTRFYDALRSTNIKSYDELLPLSWHISVLSVANADDNWWVTFERYNNNSNSTRMTHFIIAEKRKRRAK